MGWLVATSIWIKNIKFVYFMFFVDLLELELRVLLYLFDLLKKMSVRLFKIVDILCGSEEEMFESFVIRF